MKRKLIKQGGGGLTVYIPKKWIDARELKPGDEVEFKEEKGKLIISPESEKKKKEINIKIENSYQKNIRFLLNELYRQGYDKIKVNVKDSETIKTVQRLVEELFFEMDVITKSENSCMIEMISEPNFENYYTILKKLIFIIQDSMNNILKGNAKEVEKATNKYRKYDNFCRRFVFLNIRGKENFETNSLLIHLLMIQTDLRRLAKQKANKKMLEEISKYFKEAYTAFFKKNLKDLYRLNKKINSFLEENKKTKKITVSQHQCLEIARILYSAIVPMIGLSLKIKSID